MTAEAIIAELRRRADALTASHYQSLTMAEAARIAATVLRNIADEFEHPRPAELDSEDGA